MNISVFWGRVLGFYTVVMAIWSFLHLKIVNPLENAVLMDFISNPLYIFNLGIFTLFMGLVVLISHQVWRGWPIIITLLSYWIVAKGLLLLFFSQWLHEKIVFWQGENALTRAIIEFSVGMVLLFCSYFRAKKLQSKPH